MKRCIVTAVIALNFCGSLLSASAVSENEIRDWLAMWQKREGLEQWQVNLRFVHQHELGRHLGRYSIADVRWWGMPGTADVRFMYPRELETVFGDTPVEARDEAQRIVIHELMHLVVAQLYDDGTNQDDAWLDNNRRYDARMESITDNLAVLLLRGRAQGGMPVGSYITRQIDRGPWKPAPDVRERVILQIDRATNAANGNHTWKAAQVLAWFKIPPQGDVLGWVRWYFAMFVGGCILGAVLAIGLAALEWVVALYYWAAGLYYRALLRFYEWRLG